MRVKLKAQARVVPIEFKEQPTDTGSRYATNIVVQYTGDEFILNFYEVRPPMNFGDTEEERKEQMASVTSVPAECVARIIVSAGRMPGFAQAINTNLVNFQEKHGQDE